MSDFKGEREQGALEGVTKEYFELQPVAFSLLLAAAAIGWWLVEETLLAEWMLLISGGLLGWMLAWGPGKLWQRMATTAVLASAPLFFVAFGVNAGIAAWFVEWLEGKSVLLYALTRPTATVLSALSTGVVFRVAGHLLGICPVWASHKSASNRRWGIAESLVLTAILAFAVASLSYVVEIVVREKLPVFQFLEPPSRGYESLECYLLLATQVLLFVIVELLLTLFIYLPVTFFIAKGALAGVPVRTRLRRLLDYTAGWCLPLFLWTMISVDVGRAVEITGMVFTMVFALALFIASFRDLTWKSTRVGAGN